MTDELCIHDFGDARVACVYCSYRLIDVANFRFARVEALKERNAELHRRAQRAESALAKAERRIRYEREAYERMRDVVCEAWMALPKAVRDEIEHPRMDDDFAPDLVRGVRMLVDESASRIDDLERETSSLATRCHALHQRFDAPGAVTDAEARGREQGRLAAEREHAVELGRRDTLDAERSVVENALRRQLGRVEAQVAAMRNAGQQGERS